METLTKVLENLKKLDSITDKDRYLNYFYIELLSDISGSIVCEETVLGDTDIAIYETFNNLEEALEITEKLLESYKHWACSQ